MKITIAYLPAEAAEAVAVQEAIQRIYPAVKVRKSDRKPPFIHLYLTTKKAANPFESRENP